MAAEEPPPQRPPVPAGMHAHLAPRPSPLALGAAPPAAQSQTRRGPPAAAARPSRKRPRPSADAPAPAGDTLFFPSLSAGLDCAAGLRPLLRPQPHEIKFRRRARAPSGPMLAWATFSSAADAAAALAGLRRDMPQLRPRLHTPSAGAGAERKGGGVPPEETFRLRADKVVAEGGTANTVLLRGLPKEVDGAEVEQVLACIAESCRALRVRSSEMKGGGARNFWLTYPSRDAACAAYVAMAGEQAVFRCGRTQRLNPAVHNDATDAEARVRRAREAALGPQPEDGGSGDEHARFFGERGVEEVDAAVVNGAAVGGNAMSNLALLERHLREQPGRLYFLDET